MQGQRGCSPSVYIRLYRSLDFPVVTDWVLMWVAAGTEGCKEFGKIQKCPMHVEGFGVPEFYNYRCFRDSNQHYTN